MEEIFKRPIQSVKGVGSALSKKLNKLGVSTIEDALRFYPREYEDRSISKEIINLIDGDLCTVRARVMTQVSQTRPRRNLTIYKTVISDDTFTMNVTWFNQHYIKNALKPDDEYFFFGRVKRSGNRIEMMNPVYEKPVDETRFTMRILPVYKLTSGLTQTHIRKIVENAVGLTHGGIYEIIPNEIRTRYRLSEINYCIENIHFPKSMEDCEKARYRLVFEELLLLQMGLLDLKRGSRKKRDGIQYKDSKKVKELIESLPFKLTNAQERVLKEIVSDMTGKKQMNRLIQGDVGSGKTIIAVLSMFLAVENGYQAVFMAPTEILAEQHLQSISAILSPCGIKTSLLTGHLTSARKLGVKQDIETGISDVIIGTHALLQEDVKFSKLGLVITDEQHRFGVKQRALLSSKSENPDILVMTATPIPRTLALILYGDLDISVIDELPPSRKPIKTYAVDESMRERINNFIRKEVAMGRQAYIVCPLVEESEVVEAEAAKDLAERVRNNYLKGLSVGLIHGRLKASEKEETMREFSEGRLDILVSTTVIEVGVNVPNATLMIIENAERFGLAQLHQLRGRVGRGAEQSYCILYNQNSNSMIAKKRMEIMQSTNDGFLISEKDLEIRGPGDFFGTRQHGLPEFKIANLYKDMDILKDAQQVAFEIMDNEKNPDYKRLKQELVNNFKEKLEAVIMN